MPKVSVIVPVYGVEKYIERCARSLFEQTLDEIEFIFVDDCTPDSSMVILNKIIGEYRHSIVKKKWSVKIEKMATNSGQAIVRRHGVQLATGDYIIHCDSDDWVDNNLYLAMYEKAKDDESDLVVCDYCIHDGEKNISEQKGCRTPDKKEFFRRLLLQEASWSLCNKLFRRDLYDLYVEIYPVNNMGEDMVITLQLMQGVNKISYIDNEKYYYFINYNSISRTSSVEAVISRFEHYICNYRIIKEQFEKQGIFDDFQKECAWLEYSVKSMLNYPDQKCRDLWKKTFPYVEYKVLFYKDVSLKRKKEVVKTIIKHLL